MTYEVRLKLLAFKVTLLHIFSLLDFVVTQTAFVHWRIENRVVKDFEYGFVHKEILDYLSLLVMLQPVMLRLDCAII